MAVILCIDRQRQQWPSLPQQIEASTSDQVAQESSWVVELEESFLNHSQKRILHRLSTFELAKTAAPLRLAKLAAPVDGWKSMTYQCRGLMAKRE